ncbi:MAG: RodZ domain-containing protein [Pseudomonadota bacterium]
MSSDLKIGEYLQKIREEQGYSLQDVSSAINVRKGQLRAIEEGKIDLLPGKIYGVGFVKSYAGFLELDAEAAGNQFKLEHYAAPPPSEEEQAEKKKQEEKLMSGSGERDNRVPSLLVIIVAAIILAASFIGWTYFQPDDTELQKVLNNIPDAPEVEVASSDIDVPVTPGQADENTTAEETVNQQDNISSVTTTTLPKLNSPSSDENTASPEPQPQISSQEQAETQPLKLNETKKLQKRNSNSRVTLRANADSWVKITNSSGRSLFQKVLRPGDEFMVPNEKGLVMATGNAGGLDIYIDGEQINPIGRSGDIMRGVSLDPEELTAPRYSPERR